jgi:hypothetical protein
LQQTKKLFFWQKSIWAKQKFSYPSQEVQLHVRSSSSTLFFPSGNPTIKIVSICPGFTSKPHKYLIYNDMSLLSLVHGVMPPLNHHSHAKFKSLAYGRHSYCLLFLKMIPKSCKFWKYHLDKKVSQFWYLPNSISFTSFRLVV